MPAIVLELKYGHSCEEAIKQIKEKQYVKRVQEYDKILLIGINFDEKKRHTCKIELFTGM